MADRRAGADLAQASQGPAKRRAAPASDRGTRRTVPARSAGSSCGQAHSTHCTRTHSLSQSVAVGRSREGARRYALANGRCVTEAAAAEAGGYIAPSDVTTATSRMRRH
ncbi:hypothetical protein SFRURICE_020823 [Spodoptera frugiperda]|uniref:Uncharacterized protein n=1 Tax=Spodoptera exigua TaxID=7107 RepID=A0A922SKA5_SPOEX|nr:hypothetical protein SFRURICE_020823 [Spodoptera frugiperda]KAH9640233.1 hypothetical protein HF086_013432 [Spodoptera exigua]